MGIGSTTTSTPPSRTDRTARTALAAPPRPRCQRLFLAQQLDDAGSLQDGLGQSAALGAAAILWKWNQDLSMLDSTLRCGQHGSIGKLHVVTGTDQTNMLLPHQGLLGGMQLDQTQDVTDGGGLGVVFHLDQLEDLLVGFQ